MSNVLGYVSTDLETPYEGELDLENLDEWYQDKIDEAVRLLIRKIPNLVARIASHDASTSTGLDPLFVKDKVMGAVLRVLRDPEGISEESEGNYSYKRNPVVASANIWYTKDELADLGVTSKADKPRTVWASTRYGWP
jgi:hypothetical protein